MVEETLKQKSKKLYDKSGLRTMKKALNVLGSRGIDKRTRRGKALAQWKSKLIKDLAGHVSTQQAALVDLAAVTIDIRKI